LALVGIGLTAGAAFFFGIPAWRYLADGDILTGLLLIVVMVAIMLQGLIFSRRLLRRAEAKTR
jgi:hypothetical protein